MKKFIGKIARFAGRIFYSLQDDINLTMEELHAIARNRNYAKHYSKLFAIFGVLEHEQNANAFDLNAADFEVIKNKILFDEKVNNHHILEALRGLFRNNHFIDVENEAKSKIVSYLFDETIDLIEANNGYYALLTKSVLNGFPFLLNFNDYEIFKKLLCRKSQQSLRLIKFVLDHAAFSEFILNKKDLFELVSYAFEHDNKPAFMLLVRHLRKNNLLVAGLFASVEFTKIINHHKAEKFGLDYATTLLAYCSDEFLAKEKKREEIAEFLKGIFSGKAKFNYKQKLDNYYEFMLMTMMARRLGRKNFAFERMLENILRQFVEQKTIKRKTVARYVIRARKTKPSSKIQVRSFFAMAPRTPEEHWLSRFAAYLL